MATEQVCKPWVEFRINLGKAACFLLAVTEEVMLNSLLQHDCGKLVANGDVSFCPESFPWLYIVFTDVTWMHLALPNWLGRDCCSEDVCAALGCQQPAHKWCPIWYSVSKARHRRNKRLVEHLVGTKSFSKRPWLNVFGTCQARYCSANWTSHSLLSGLAGIRLSISEDL